MQHKKQVGIQVARAIAALSIVYFHSWTAITRFPKDTAYPIPGLSNYGWFAVDLFFAISGYVICLVVSRGTFSPSSFLLKRAFRPLPIGLFFLIVAFANLETSENAWWRKPAVALGDASYSIYLIHPIIFLFASSTISKLPFLPLWVEEPIRFGCIGIVISCAFLSWKYFEKPTLQAGERMADLLNFKNPINISA
jgi:peptidoglycan/LPS O-acetylase OafA/YrhL